MRTKILIETEAGSTQKNYYDEKTLQWSGSRAVAAPYPYPYGFVIGTISADGGCVDCFVITRQPLAAGQAMLGEVIGLMEQFEGDEIDHKVLLRPVEEGSIIDAQVQQTLTDFIYRLFAGAEIQIRVGRFLGPDQAEMYLAASRDKPV